MSAKPKILISDSLSTQAVQTFEDMGCDVTVSGKLTPEELLHMLKPDVLVKGGDYGIDQVLGADIVRSAGGEVKVLSLVEDCSTSALVEKIRSL